MSLAHHSVWGVFDPNERFSITGTVTEVEWINPHIFMHLDVADDDGSFHTTDLRVVERLTRTGDKLVWQATAHDPAVLAEPWAMRPRTATLTDIEILQAPRCIDRDLPMMRDVTLSHDNPR